MVGAVSADVVSQSAIDPPAIIGKLPGHGDFLARRVDYVLREPLDRWMSDWIELARQELGDDFEAAYESAAPWLMESAAANAVLMPSVDAVGRLYPVLAVCSSSAWTQDIYDALIQALDQGMLVDDLCGRLGELDQKGGDRESTGKPEWFLPEGAELVLPNPSVPSSWTSVREHFA
ncbi:MAG: type VI secretion system-associated protein TagF [Pseudomonadota bacterium]